MCPILLDFETRSRCDLKKHGGRLYFEDESTEALCCALHDTDTGTREMWERGDPIPTLVSYALETDTPFAAHNMIGFDRFGLHRLGWSNPVRDERVPLIDTSELARAAGLPGALDALGTRWLNIPKDKVASKFTKGLSSVRRPAGKGPEAISADDWRQLSKYEQRLLGKLPECGPEEMNRVKAYCSLDVDILEHGWPLLEGWQDLEPAVSRAERRVNDRGIGFDSELARRLLEEDARNGDITVRRVARALGMSPAETRKIARSDSQFPEYTGLPNAQAATVDDALLDPRSPPRVRLMCEARQALASIARGKLEAGLARVSPDGRMRDTHRYLGAHTWRWSGRGMQLQNMPRPDKRFENFDDWDIRALVDYVMGGGNVDADEINLLLRACLVAKPGHVFVVRDFSGVEARALAWCAGDQKALDVFANPAIDPYKVAASGIYGVPYDAVTKDQRQQGKVGELACGYQGGPGAIERFAAKMGIPLEPGLAQKIVTGWRQQHAPTVRFWYELQRGFEAAITGRTVDVDCFTFTPSEDGEDVAVFMPDGTPLVYNSARLSRDERGRSRITFHGQKAVREDTYGGKITENLIQRLCRQLMADALARSDSAMLNPVLHIHDEIVIEIPAESEREATEEFHHIMTTVPEWAETFPIGAAGHSGERYRK